MAKFLTVVNGVKTLANETILYQSAEPPKTTGIVWQETDNLGNILYGYPWLWDSTYNGWFSPIMELPFFYRNDSDSGMAIGDKRIILTKLYWYLYHLNSQGANRIFFKTNMNEMSVTIPITTANTYCFGIVSDINQIIRGSYLEIRYSFNTFSNVLINNYGSIQLFCKIER